MGRGASPGRGLWILTAACLLVGFSSGAVAQDGPPREPETSAQASPSDQPLELTADQLAVNRETEVYQADGSVVVVQGDTRLTADHVTFRALTGELIAIGRVHLERPSTDLWADRLRMNLNTEAGLVVHGQLFDKASNTTVTGEMVRRFSEDRYRVRNGSITNCDVMEGQVPDWRFEFEDVDLTLGDRVYLKNAWFCVRDVPIIPIPRFTYPVGVRRKTGFLIPTPGFNNEFGFTYQQAFFWAPTPSQDMTLTPIVLTKRGYGGNVEYRYILSRQNRGQWLLNAIQDTEQDRGRGVIRGSHTAQFKSGLTARAKAFMVSDRTYLEDFANAGVLRALPSADSTLDIRQSFEKGSAYVLAQYLQPLQAGSEFSFQRLPEVGGSVGNLRPFDGPVVLGGQGSFVNWWREKGFDLGRLDILPTSTMKPWYVNHVLGLTPSVFPRFVFYTRGSTTEDSVQRATVWASMRANSRLRRRFRTSGGAAFVNSIVPEVVYEYVPETDQSDIVQIDAIDNLPKKHLLSYSLRTTLTGPALPGGSTNWLDLTVAQSYQVENPTGTAFGANALRRRFSNLWIKAVLGQVVTIDSFFDTYLGEFSQFNTDLHYRFRKLFYVDVGQRFSRKGTRVRRGDIWNPLSYGEVFVSSTAIQFLTATAAVQLPFNITLGARVYRDIEARETPEIDVVGLYQSPCRCWSVGVYFIDLDQGANQDRRTQFSILLHLRGIGNTDSLGARMLKALLSPLLGGEAGVPWQ